MLLEAMGRMRKNKAKLWRGISVDLYDQYAEGKTITVFYGLGTHFFACCNQAAFVYRFRWQILMRTTNVMTHPTASYQWWSVSSCTADESVARNFMNGSID